jgi:ssDNA-binding Zn-finger/Zn-ribbon topoisomerase 1
MSREDFTTLWVKKSTVARLAATGDGTADEQINAILDNTSVDRINELEKQQEQYKIMVPCSVCGRELVILKDTECYTAIKKYAKEKCWGCPTCLQKVKTALRKMHWNPQGAVRELRMGLYASDSLWFVGGTNPHDWHRSSPYA